MEFDYKKRFLELVWLNIETHNNTIMKEFFCGIPTIEEKLEIFRELYNKKILKNIPFYVSNWLFINKNDEQVMEFINEKEMQLFIDFVEGCDEGNPYQKLHMYGAALSSIKNIDLFKYFVDKITISYFLEIVQNETLDKETIGKDCVNFFQKDLLSKNDSIPLEKKEDKISYVVILLENEKFATAKKTIKQLELKVDDFVDYLKEDSDFALKCLKVFRSKEDCDKIINYYVEVIELNKKLNKKVFLNMFNQIMGDKIDSSLNKDKEKQIVIDVCEYLIKDNDKNKIIKLLEQIKPEFVGKASSYLESITSHFSFKELGNALKTPTNKIKLKM